MPVSSETRKNMPDAILRYLWPETGRLADYATGRNNNFNLIRVTLASMVLIHHAFVLTGNPVAPRVKEVTVTAGGTVSVDFALPAVAANLSQVVVVGYGTQERRDVTGAVSSIKSQNIKDLPVTSLDQKIVGQVAGVQVNQVSGAPAHPARRRPPGPA